MSRNVAENDLWIGPPSFTILGQPGRGTAEIDANGQLTYDPEGDFIGQVSFEYMITDGYWSDTATIYIDYSNLDPSATDNTFDYPPPGVPFVNIEVLFDDYDGNGDTVEINSVTQPSDGGTTTIVDGKIRLFPPSDYANNPDPTIDVSSTGVEFFYDVKDSLGLVSQKAKVEAGPVRWDASLEYSRGNDDPNENIYETGKVRVELLVDTAGKNVKLKYTATSSTDSLLAWGPNGGPINVTSTPNTPGATPEFEFFQPYLFLQPEAKTGLVDANDPGVPLTFANGELSAELEVATWTQNPSMLSGKAVVQMRVTEVYLNGRWQPAFVSPEFLEQFPANQKRLAYLNVRQEIPWSTKFETKKGSLLEKETSLEVNEIPFLANGTTGQIVTPLRIVDSSNGEGEVYKVGYPAHPGVARKDFNPLQPGAQDDPNVPGDQRAEPATAIPEWNVKVRAKTK